jgi:hypothetical protein
LITALRVVLSLIRFESEDLSWIDFLALYELIIKIEEQLMLVPSFVKKYGTLLKSVTDFLIETGLAPTNPKRFLRPFRIVLERLPDSFFINERNLNTELLKMREQIFLVEIKPTGTKIKYLPPKAFIGKGYGDKGARRKPEKDASPTWQEVASSLLPRDLQKEFERYLAHE